MKSRQDVMVAEGTGSESYTPEFASWPHHLTPMGKTPVGTAGLMLRALAS